MSISGRYPILREKRVVDRVKKPLFGRQIQGGLVYQTPMTIDLAPLNQKLMVLSFHHEDERNHSDLESRLMHLGFFAGETIRIMKRAPLFQEPFLVEVRGRMVALSREEARLVKVEVRP